MRGNRKYNGAFNSDNRFFVCITSREKAMFAYLNLVTSYFLPVSHVSKPIIRTFAKFDDVFSVSYFKESLFKQHELMEKRIGEDM